MKRCFSLLLALFITAAVPRPALSWNGLGYMEVAAIAWEELTPTAKVAAGKLLRLNPLYASWIDNVAPVEHDRIAFIKSAKWADVIKRLSPYQPDGMAGSNGNRPLPGPDAVRNIGYADHLQHKYWHFIDVPFSPDQTQLALPDIPNIQTQIAALRAALSQTSGASDEIRSYDLVWLIHLLGDVHQPLHTTARFTHDHPEGDQGGNLVPVRCGTGCSSVRNLHAFWDGVLGSSQSTEFAIEAAARLPKADEIQAAISDERRWIDESVAIAKSTVYASIPVDLGETPFTLSADYKAHARDVAEQQIALAGARLARLLNQALQ